MDSMTDGSYLSSQFNDVSAAKVSERTPLEGKYSPTNLKFDFLLGNSCRTFRDG